MNFREMTKEEIENAEKQEQAREDKELKAIEYRIKELINSRTPPKYRMARIEHVPQLAGRTEIDTLLFYGNYGTGKTYASFALARHLIESSTVKTFEAVSAYGLMMKIKEGFSAGDYEARVKKYIKCGLLIVDEYGKNAGTDFEEAVMYEILAERYNWERRTIVITNAADKEKLTEIVRHDILDRYRAGIVEFKGKSKR